MAERKADANGLYEGVGRKIRDAREHAAPKMSQDKLAKRLGMSRASVVNIEAGRQHAPLHLLWQIADILGTDLTLLIPRRDDLSPPAHEVTLDKNTLRKIEIAAKGNPETRRILAGFVSELKTTLESTGKKKGKHDKPAA